MRVDFWCVPIRGQCKRPTVAGCVVYCSLSQALFKCLPLWIDGTAVY